MQSRGDCGRLAPSLLPVAVLAARRAGMCADEHAGDLLACTVTLHRVMENYMHIYAQTSMRDYQDQEMSTAIWAMGTLGRSNEALLEACAQEAMRRGFETFAPQAISNFVWGFAVLGYCNNAFLTVRPLLRGPPPSSAFCPVQACEPCSPACPAPLLTHRHRGFWSAQAAAQHSPGGP